MHFSNTVLATCALVSTGLCAPWKLAGLTERGFPGLAERGFPDLAERGFPDLAERGFPDLLARDTPSVDPSVQIKNAQADMALFTPVVPTLLSDMNSIANSLAVAITNGKTAQFVSTVVVGITSDANAVATAAQAAKNKLGDDLSNAKDVWTSGASSLTQQEVTALCGIIGAAKDLLTGAITPKLTLVAQTYHTISTTSPPDYSSQIAAVESSIKSVYDSISGLVSAVSGSVSAGAQCSDCSAKARDQVAQAQALYDAAYATLKTSLAAQGVHL